MAKGVARAILGAAFVLGGLRAFGNPSGNVFQANSMVERLGMYMSYCLLIAIGCWLMKSGLAIAVRPSVPGRRHG